ncbi:MAG: EAL and modified HD-GYP domain-containing signal transduction protein [Methylophagaceae bacterium]|jgi:EAL and modified HD-GYP domain-containing signal transduction protein
MTSANVADSISADSISADSIFLARQPIFDQDLVLFAYELLFRSNETNQSGVDVINGDSATSQVINNTFLEFGIEDVLGGKLGFINLTRAFLTREIPLPFHHHNVVLEVLEDIKIDDEIIKSVKQFSEQGFTIALDDFIYHEDLKPLVDVANIIKIDLLALSAKELIEHVKILKPFNVRLLAEKVETEAQFQLCKELGFDYYQGYFFCKPTILDGKPLPENKMTSLRLLSELQRPEISIKEVEELIKHDVSLSLKLLRCLNSAAFSFSKPVDSIKEAVIYLGLDTIKSWATIISFSKINAAPPTELLTTALVRAKMSESLASHFDCARETAFTLGLFSVTDALLNRPMLELLKPLPLSTMLKVALLNEEGPLGALLIFLKAHERGSLTDIPDSLSIAIINQAFLTATVWVNDSLESIK